MAETAAPDPDKPTHRLLPDMSNLQEFWLARLDTPINGRLTGPEDLSPFMFMPDPPVAAAMPHPRVVAAVVKVKRLRVKARASIHVALRERVRVKVYDHILRWISRDLDRIRGRNRSEMK